MQFDKIIMNPPYKGNLHLQILSEVIKLFNNNSICINLSPVRWLQDPLAEYKQGCDFKKFEDVKDKISNLKLISQSDANKVFNIGLMQPLGIYTLTNKGGYDCSHNEFYQKIFAKIIKDNNFSKLNIVNYTDDLENYVCLNTFAPPMKYGNPMFRWLKDTGVCDKNNNYRKWKDNNPAATRGDVGNTTCIVFNTRKEAENCYNSMETILARFLCMTATVDVHVYPKLAPFMSDYTEPWTDERLKKYFGITDTEWNKILEIMGNL